MQPRASKFDFYYIVYAILSKMHVACFVKIPIIVLSKMHVAYFVKILIITLFKEIYNNK